MPTSGLPTSVALFAESLDAVARIRDEPDRANAHLAVVRAMYACGSGEAARKLSNDTLDLVFRVPDPGERAYLLRLLAVQQAQMREFDDAANAFSFIPAGNEQKGYAMREIGEAMAAAGRVRQAVKIAERIEDLDDYEAVFKSITEYLIAQGRLDAAVQASLRVEPSPLRVALFCAVAKKRFRLGETEPALALIRNVLPQVKGFANAVLRNESLRIIAETFIELDRALDARTALVEIDDPYERTFPLCQLGLSTHLIDPAAARTLLEDTSISTRKIEEPWKRARGLAQVALAFDEIGRRDVGGRLFREATGLIVGIGNPHQQIAESIRIVGQLAESGRREETRTVLGLALGTADEVDELPFRLRLMGMIAHAQIESALVDDAEATIRMIETAIAIKARQNKEMPHLGPPYSAPLLVRLAYSRRDLDLCDEKEFAGQVNAAVQSARRLVDPLDRADALRELAEAVAEYEKGGVC